MFKQYTQVSRHRRVQSDRTHAGLCLDSKVILGTFRASTYVAGLMSQKQTLFSFTAGPVPGVVELRFSCFTISKVSMKYEQLMNVKTARITGIFRF